MARLPNKDEYLPVQRYHTKSVDVFGRFFMVESSSYMVFKNIE